MTDTKPSLTVRKLVSQAELRLTCVSGTEGLGNAVESVYIGDLEDPVPWMAPGSVLLTTGRVFVDDPKQGADLIQRLANSGMAAMGVAITPYISRIDPLLKMAAEKEHLPLLRIPPDTPFRVITEYIGSLLNSRDLHRLRRNLTMQNQLLGALRVNGRVGLVQRLSALLSTTAVLYDSHGRLLTNSGFISPLQSADLWASYYSAQAEHRPRSVFPWNGALVPFRDVTDGKTVCEVLMLPGIPGEGLNEITESALTFSHRLLELERVAEQNVGERSRDLFRSVIRHGAEEDEVKMQLARHRLIEPKNWYVLSFITERADAVAVIHRQLQDTGVPSLAIDTERCVFVLVESENPVLFAEATQRVLQSKSGRGYAGISRAVQHHGRISDAVHEALSAALLTDVAEPEPRLFDQLALHTRAMTSVDTETLTTIASSVFSPLQAHPELAETLSVYIEHRCSVSASAKKLCLHRNTLRKRLDRIEDITGLELGSQFALTDVVCAETAAKIIDLRKEIDRIL